ncbi:MAG: M43 family zinc metalloprotease [Flavipsychrobacter sp.]
MIRKITLLFLACLGVHFASYAQKCGFDIAHQSLMSQNTSYAQKVNQFNTNWASFMASQSNPNALLVTLPSGQQAYEIPVVVHVMYTNQKAAYNVSDANIERMIDYLSHAYQATWPSYPGTSSRGTRIPVTFKLAKRTPNCTSTNGIVRYEVTSTANSDYYNDGIKLSSTNGTAEINIKNLSRWPNSEYYNIWVVNKIDGADGLPGTSGPYTAGYAYFPGAPATIDGTVMLASQVDSGKATITHELGHALDLYHTFEGDAGGASCPPNGNCATQGDRVCDTEPHKRSVFNCPSGTNICTGTPYGGVQHNFMDYSNCKDHFTAGQSTRVMAAFFGERASLITSLGATPLPTTSLPTTCIPTYVNTTTPQNYGPRNIVITKGTTKLMDVSSSGYIGDGNLVHYDRTCEHMVTLTVDSTYNFSVSTVPGEKAKVYIDYNNDGVFGNSAGESISLSNGNPHTNSFTVPSGTNVTQCIPIRMRVISDFTTGNIDSCGPINYGQAEDYLVLIKGNNATSATVTITNPPKGGNPSCFGTELTFNTTTTATPIAWQWYINSSPVSGQTVDSFKSTIFADNDTVKVRMIYGSLCGFDTVFSNQVIVDRVTSVAPQVTIGVTGGSLPTCFDDTVTISVTGNVNPGGAPTYYWTANGNPIAGATGTTFKAYQLTANTQIRAVMKSSAGAPCATPDSGISNALAMTYTTKTPVTTIALTIGTNPGCANQTLQFTANTTVGGTTPLYQWFVNGSPVTGVSTNNTYTSSTLNNTDVVRCRTTSSSVCASPASVNSNNIAIVHTKITADISIAQTSGGNPACQGKNVIFAANTTNAGANPNFQWLVNGNIVAGATNPIFITNSLGNNDNVSCVLIATDPCVENPLDTSSAIVMNITPSKVPKINVTITKGKNPGCLDSLVEFTATATDIGANPNFRWLVNNFPVGFGPVFSTSTLLNGNTVVGVVNQTDGNCYLPDTVFATPIKMVRTVTPNPPLISLVGNEMITNISGSFIWFGPDSLLTGQGEDGRLLPKAIGPYYALTNDNGCWSKPSNILTITLLDIKSLDMKNFSIFPNPTKDQVRMDWKGERVNMEIGVYNTVGQLMFTDNVKNASSKTINMANLANGMYYIVLTDEQGNSGKVKVTVAR